MRCKLVLAICGALACSVMLAVRADANSPKPATTQPVAASHQASTTKPGVDADRAMASTASADGLAFFEKKIRPLLSEQCYKCHSSQASKVKGELLLDSQAAMLKGGSTGPAVVPGHIDQSLLIEAVSYKNDDLKMPPKNRLSESAVADLTRWVQMGAPMPADTAGPGKAVATASGSTPRATAADYERLRKEHWAWQPLHEGAVPRVKDVAWPRNDVDRFLLSSMEARSISPVGDADRTTLIRRVTFDLTGLPPTPEEVSSFVADHSADSYSRLVDRLLASPAFGERWGRHWLDVVRYAESTGSSRNYPYAYAYRYRDWVISAVNNDKPYNQFITEQIAGDLMPYSSSQQHDEQRIATGFLAIGVKDVSERDRLKYMMDNIDEQIDVTSRSIMAMTVSCARCHDHKFDPIPQSDYYALAGIFRSTDILAGVHNRVKGGGLAGFAEPTMLVHLDLTSNGSAPPPPSPDQLKAQSASALHVADLQAQITKHTLDIARLRRQPNAKGNGDYRREYAEAVRGLRQAKLELDEAEVGAGAAPDPSVAAVGVRDARLLTDQAICVHGDADNTGSLVTRGFPTLFSEQTAPQIDRSHSGRLQLADWLTRSDNPLTARVMVNRVWSHLFGEGLVRTIDNFGTTGEAPSNPALLDHLANQFMQDGWSVKQLIRSLVLTHAYQLAGTRNSADFAADPSDRLQWRMAPRRLDAEEIHDAMLAAAGNLDRKPVVGSMAMLAPTGEIRAGRTDSAADVHRGVYLPIMRDLVPPMLELFDFAEPTLVTGQRDVTTVATQALFMMNDPFVIQQSHHMAQRVLQSSAHDDAGRVDLAYKLAVDRAATAQERTRAIRYVNEFVIASDRKPTREDAWASFCQALLASAEFRYLN